MTIDAARIQAMPDLAELGARLRPIDLRRLRDGRLRAIPRVAIATPVRRGTARCESAAAEGSSSR